MRESLFGLLVPLPGGAVRTLASLVVLAGGKGVRFLDRTGNATFWFHSFQNVLKSSLAPCAKDALWC